MGGVRRREVLAGLTALPCLPAHASGGGDSPALLLVPIGGIGEGELARILWHGQPVFIRHRTTAEIAAARAVPLSELRDPERDEDRTENPNWLVVVGRCPHQGCEPLGRLGDYGGWLCLCHGSHFDLSGRIRKGPAPTNLAVPPHHFRGRALLAIGAEQS